MPMVCERCSEENPDLKVADCRKAAQSMRVKLEYKVEGQPYQLDFGIMNPAGNLCREHFRQVLCSMTDLRSELITAITEGDQNG